MSELDWTEDFHLENGNYMNRCCKCDNVFFGYKRRHICKKCHTYLSELQSSLETVKHSIKESIL